MVFIILVIWVFAWTPYVVESMWIMFFDGLYLTPELAIAPSLCCKLSAALNAFIYGVRYALFYFQRRTKTSRRLVFVQVGLKFLASKNLVHLSGYYSFKHHIGGGQQQKLCAKSSKP